MDSLNLQKHVCLVINDVAAAGCRALLGLHHCSASSIESIAFVEGLPTCSGLVDVEGNAMPGFFKVDLPAKEATMLALNYDLNGSLLFHVVVDRLIQKFRENLVSSVTVVVAVHVKGRDVGMVVEDVYEYNLNSPSEAGYPNLPEGISVVDNTLHALIQYLMVEGIPSKFLLVPSYRVKPGTWPNSEDGSLQAISVIQGIMSRLLGLEFSLEKSMKLKYSVIDEPASLPPYMYL